MEEECALAWKRLAVHREVLPAASSTEEWAQPTTETEPSSPAGLLAGAAMGLRGDDDDDKTQWIYN